VLAPCNLRDRAYEAGRADFALAGARKALHARQRDLEAFIAALVAELNARELTAEELSGVMNWEQMASLRNGGPPGSALMSDEAKLSAWKVSGQSFRR
jgi:hypothetical protein